ncbi:BsuPI-related putative proteinase inhibitor [Gracilibacillus sp. S3-1-1]|uniref:Uncharacterized protein n=1 Tax=Gracilibacillus pellucidus TaxID=3095368 RepID=A0ACC6M4C0_9BACI|nr:BsuPI-related putative proteinase inhibitor [Gracilibacillus sp. S3-1-1]MDX8045769.1 BsuPI-related putative proteinase inhibitor [Gracilibacillus sp. S3-1-1]
MKKILLLVSMIAILGLVACGNGEEGSKNAEPINNAEAISSIIQNLSLEVETEQQEEQLVFTLQLLNDNEEEVDFTFATDQQYEIILSQDGQAIYQYSEDQMFTQAIVEETLAAGDVKEWTESWNIPTEVEAGEYEVEVSIIPSKINEQVVEGEPLQQTTTVTIEATSQKTKEETNESEQPEVTEDTEETSSATEEQDKSTEDTSTKEEEDGPFRSIDVSGEKGQYVVKGQVDTSIGTTYYEVEDGHNYLVEQTELPVKGEGWQDFEVSISVSEDLLPYNGTVMMILYNEDRSEQVPVQLEVIE